MFGRACTKTWTSQRSHSLLFSKTCWRSRSRSTSEASLHLDSRVRPTVKHTLRSAPIPSAQYCRRYLQQNAFESLGIFPPLARNLKNLMAIQEPTLLQSNFIPPILTGKDVLIRDTTGSGKTFGILLALLSKPRRRIGPDRRPGITSVIVVPNQELAFQLQSWAQSLFPSANEQQMQEMLQVIVTPSVSILSNSDDLSLNRPKLGSRKRSKKGTKGSLSAIPEPDVVDKQVQTLAETLPHVLVATPARLWSLVERGVLDLSGIETLVLDEVDHLIRLPKRFASQREIENRDKHPKPAELAVREIIRSAQAAGRYGTVDEKTKEGQESNEQGSLDRIQIIAASATMNRPMRYWLESNNWVQDPEWVDTTKSVVLPEGIEHHCLVIGAQSIRNMRLESDRTPWNERGLIHENSESRRVNDEEEEVDWDEKDQAWKKDKELSWKEQQLEAGGASLDGENQVEKFRDDDDRILEGVATACMLDKVENACVFFCSSFSLGDLATRLALDFGLEVKQIQSAFEGRNDEKQGMIVGTSKNSRKGIYIAHESNARGLDLPGLSHVYIVGLPSAPSSYIHMAGRTGRMGKKGQVVTIIRDDGHLEDRARSMFRTLNVAIQPFRHVE